MILSSKCVGSVFPTAIGTCAWKKLQDSSLIPDMIGFQALLKHLSKALNTSPLPVIKP